jgi:O-antigen/teichoic acid export membrane protein
LSKREFLIGVWLEAREHFKKNWGLPFVAGFIVLLFVAAVFLAFGAESWADMLAISAYFALAVGVLLQLTCLYKGKSKIKGVTSNGSC